MAESVHDELGKGSLVNAPCLFQFVGTSPSDKEGAPPDVLARQQRGWSFADALMRIRRAYPQVDFCLAQEFQRGVWRTVMTGAALAVSEEYLAVAALAQRHATAQHSTSS